MENQQEEKLRQEILGDAKLKAERLVARAQVNADKLVAEARAQGEEKRQQRLAEARELADKQCASILVDVEREARRYRLLGREKCLDALFARALTEAENASGDEHRRSLEALAREAMAAIGPRAMKVIFPQTDSAIVTPEWLSALGRELFGENAPVVTSEPSSDARAGLLFESLDGARSFDNTYSARLERMHELFRRKLTEE